MFYLINGMKKETTTGSYLPEVSEQKSRGDRKKQGYTWDRWSEVDLSELEVRQDRKKRGHKPTRKESLKFVFQF